jgi:hypothetical protein
MLFTGDIALLTPYDPGKDASASRVQPLVTGVVVTPVGLTLVEAGNHGPGRGICRQTRRYIGSAENIDRPHFAGAQWDLAAAMQLQLMNLVLGFGNRCRNCWFDCPTSRRWWR